MKKVAAAGAVSVMTILGVHGVAGAQQSPEPTVIQNDSTDQQLFPYGYGMNDADELQIWAQRTPSPQGRYWKLWKLPDGYFQIQNVDTGKCMAVGQYYTPNMPVQRRCDTNTEDQHWQVEKQGERGYTIRNKSTGEALIPMYPNINTTATVLQDQTGSNQQLWRFSNSNWYG